MLVTAAHEGNLPAIKELIKRGHLKPKSPNLFFKTHPLFAAIRADEPEIALELLSAGIDFTWMDHGLVTALHVASEVELDDVIIKLLELGANPNARDDDIRSPLLWAAWAGRDEIVDLLIERGAHSGLGNTRSPSVITEAIRGGNLDLARRLITRYDLSSTAIVKSLQYMPIAWNGGISGRTFALNLGIDLDNDNYLFDAHAFGGEK
ncbi:hypothetical protein PRZ48_010826 [Zasmidium cellare]|uniref:Ankyrin repeat domain-containing protein n=1 Tax=Zasmidium cellare TaxID=395010 RepID=A0ABR0E9S3_ZASCE|nr:hypothetical protein PRZ48_010826 [Zasmidium cellare]